MTTAHCSVAIDEGVDIHFPAIGLAILEHTHSPQTVECQPQVAREFGVFTQHGCGIRTAVGGRGEPGGTGHRDTTPGWFVATRLAVPLVVEKPGSVGRFGYFDVSNSPVKGHATRVNGPCLGLATPDVAQ